MPRYIVFDPKETEYKNAHILSTWDDVERWLKDGSILDGYMVFEVTKAWDVIKDTKLSLRVATDIT
jgi:hypothetical protein